MIKKISWKLFFTYIIIIIICVTFTGILAIISLRNFYINHLSSNLKSNATLVANILGDDLFTNNLSQIKLKTKDLGKELETRITIIDINGIVLGDSEKDPALMENHADRPEIKEALQGKIGNSVRYSSTLEIDMLYIAIPIVKNNQTLGIVRLSLPLTEVNENISNLHKIIILATAIALAIASIISLIISLTNLMSEELENKIRIISEDKDKMRVVLSGVIEGIVAIDKEGRIILFNHALKNMIDCSSDIVLGKFHWEIIRNNQLNELLKEALQKGQALTREITLFSPQEKIFHASANPLTEKNKVWGAVVVLNDITEIKKLEKMRSEFVANVSHELRTPLTSIQGFVETLKEGAINNPEKAQYFLDIIEKQSNRLNNLIEELLQLSKIESQEIAMNLQSINLRDLIDKTILEFKEKIDQKEQQVKINISPQLPLVKADPEQIEVVFRNLLDNAIKYTPNRGKISISALEKAENIYIEVADNGIGISAEHLPRIFERFYRADKDRSRKLGGTGLGLAIVKHIVQANQGTIGVESKPGKGSKFFFTLPKNS